MAISQWPDLLLVNIQSSYLFDIGRCLPVFSGRITLIGGIVVIILMTRAPQPVNMLGLSPYVVLINIMACRVYRHTRIGMIRESEISTSAIDRAILPAAHAIRFNNNVSITSEANIPPQHDGMGIKEQREALI